MVSSFLFCVAEKRNYYLSRTVECCWKKKIFLQFLNTSFKSYFFFISSSFLILFVDPEILITNPYDDVGILDFLYVLSFSWVIVLHFLFIQNTINSLMCRWRNKKKREKNLNGNKDKQTWIASQIRRRCRRNAEQISRNTHI